MIYKKFFFENFKGIQGKLEIELGEKPILASLIGLNESGKTTILKGIKLFYKLAKMDDHKNFFEMSEHWQSFRPKRTNFFTGVLKIGAEIILEEKDLKKLKEKPQQEIKDKTLKIAFIQEYKDNNMVKSQRSENIESNMDIGIVREILKDVPEVLYYDDFMFEIPKEIFFAKNNEKLNEKLEKIGIDSKRNKEWQNILNDIVEAYQPGTNLQDNYVKHKSDESHRDQMVSGMENVLNGKIYPKDNLILTKLE